jgi:hypothetical protein
MDKTVLNLGDLTVETFSTVGDGSENSIDWTGCMSECGAC